ncbi:MAG: CAIB/BAIF family protein, partial [uncultured Thermoleophilia bacterium]
GPTRSRGPDRRTGTPALRHPGARPRAVRRGSVGHEPPGRARRRHRQDREPLGRRRLGPLRAAVPGRRALVVLRDAQRGQALDLARPAPPAGPRGARGPRGPLGRRVLEPARRPAGPPGAALRRPRSRQPACRVRLPDRLRDDRPESRRGGVRLRRPGLRRLDDDDGGARRAADPHGPLAGGPVGRVRGRDGAPVGPARRRADRPGRRLRRGAARHGAGPRDLRRDLAPVARLAPGAHPQLGAPVDGAVPELRDRGRLDRGLRGQGVAVRPAVRRARRAAARRRRAVRHLRRPAATPGRGARHPRAALRGRHDGALAGRAPGGRDPVRSGQRPRGGVRGPAGQGPVRRRGDRAPGARHRPAG